MSKTGWIVLIVCLCLLFCLCAGLFLAGRAANAILSNTSGSKADSSAARNYKDLKNPYSEDGIYSVKLDDLKELNVDWISGSVIIELTDDVFIQIRESSDATIKEKDALRYGVSGNKLRIQACRKNHTGRLPRKDLILSIPRPLADGLTDCGIDTVSANVYCADLNLTGLEVNSVSGQILLRDMSAEEASVNTVSGPVSLLSCSFDSLRIDSVSGNASMTGAARKVRASSVSGPVELSLKDCNEIRVNTMSGSVTLDLVRTPKELQVDTTSGETRLTLPKDASCALDLDAVSGKLYLNDQAVGAKQLTLGEGDAFFSIDSVSGSVYVYTR